MLLYRVALCAVSDSLTEQCEKYADKLAANGYDRLLLLQRIFQPLV